jgi:cation diffusion facilitator CzcD-associated flavoprotein CzcO
VPPVADECAELDIYQRSPNYVAPKKDRAYSATTRWLFESVKVVERAYRWWIYWGLESRWLWFRKDSRAGRILGGVFARSLRQNVVSPRLPEPAVVPDYPLGCKRILISSDWYQALARPQVSVVTESIDHVEPDAIVTTDGQRRATDVIIFGTGFETTDFLSHIPVTGEGGRKLADEWEGGAHAYLGVAVPRFPNLYLLYGPNTNLGHNSILFMVERQINLILQALAVQVQAEPVQGAEVGTRARVAVTPDAYRRDDARTQRLMASTAWVSNCTSWYKTASGRVTNNWPTWTVRYWRDTLRLRSSDMALEPDRALEPLPASGEPT